MIQAVCVEIYEEDNDIVFSPVEILFIKLILKLKVNFVALNVMEGNDQVYIGRKYAHCFNGFLKTYLLSELKRSR